MSPAPRWPRSFMAGSLRLLIPARYSPSTSWATAVLTSSISIYPSAFTLVLYGAADLARRWARSWRSSERSACQFGCTRTAVYRSRFYSICIIVSYRRRCLSARLQSEAAWTRFDLVKPPLDRSASWTSMPPNALQNSPAHSWIAHIASRASYRSARDHLSRSAP